MAGMNFQTRSSIFRSYFFDYAIL
ncbi:hypothetical protein [uncultured Robinsoniella sp.]